MAYLIIGAIAAAVLLAVLVVHAIAAHLVIALGGAGVIVVLIFVVIAFVRGLSHHTVITTYQLAPPKKRPELPPPAAPQALTVPVQARDPFSAGEPGTWQDMIEAADRDELARLGPREARQPVRACEGPGCNGLLDDNPWTIEADRGQGKEEHAFCSRECLDGWHRADSAEHAGRSGIA